MDKKDNGGPVFPCAVNSAAKEQAKSVGVILEDYTGITLRDYFAAKAMNGFVSRQYSGLPEEAFDSEISKWAYQVADAMLKARK